MLKRLICIVLTAALTLGIVSIAPLKVSAASDMSVSDKCVELIKQLEGFTAVPQWDYSQWTVGFGTACPDEHLDRYLETGIPVDEAEALLAEKMVYFNGRVNNFADTYGLKLTQGQFDAIFSLTYNIGAAWMNRPTGLFHKAVTSGATGNELIFALSASCTAGGKFIKGLMTRRLAEAEMYLYEHYNRYPPEEYCYVTYDAGPGEREVAGQGYDSRLPAWPMASATYEGHIFLGWYTAAEGGTRVTTLDQSTDGMMLYAHWMEDMSQNTGTEPVYVTVQGDRVNVRSGAGLSYDVVTRVNTGDELVITEVKTADDLLWGKSELGWICLDYTNYEEAADNSQNEKPVIQLPEKTTNAVITASVINVRSGPGASYDLLTTLKQGDTVEVFALATVGDKIWAFCQHGWFRVTGYASLYNPQPGGTVTPGPQEPEDEPDEPEEPLPNVPAIGTVIGSNAISVYNGPHKSYPVLGTVQVGTELEILEFKPFMGDIWGRTKDGWVCVNDYMMIHGEDSLINTFFVTVTNTTLNLRTGPGVGNKKVGQLLEGQQAEIFELADVDGDPWGRTDNGWISLKYTNYTPSMVPDQTPPPEGCEAGDHPYNVIKVPGSCTSDGYVIYFCTSCGHNYLGEVTKATGHNYVTVTKEPTCLDDGYSALQCEYCGHKQSETVIPATGHNYISGEKAPTCTEPGYYGQVCLFCGEGTAEAEIPATGHTYTSQVIEPSCGQYGCTRYTCQTCGDSYEDSYVEALKHSYVRSIVNPTCVEEGYTAYTCRYCGLLQKKDIVAPLGHYASSVVIRPTCQNGGYTSHTCQICGEVWTDTEVPPTGEHDYVSVITLPTCVESGYTTHTCKNCGSTSVDTQVPPTNVHTYVSVVTPPTKEAEGYTTHTCDVCGHSYVDGYTEKLPATQIIEVTHTYATVTATSLNVRTGAGTNNAKVTLLPRGQKVEILEQKEVSGKIWGRYEEGWICLTDYTILETVVEKIEVEVPNPPVEDPGEDEPDPPTVDPGENEGQTITVTKIYATVTAGAVNVRSGPGSSYSKITVLHAGDVLEILEQKEVSGKIWGRYEEGWFRLTGYATLETVTEEVTVPGTGGEPEKPEPEPEPEPEPKPEPTLKTYATVTAGAVNVRKGPGASYGKVTVLHSGDRVEILEQQEVDGKIWGRYEAGWFRLTGYATLETVEIS